MFIKKHSIQNLIESIALADHIKRYQELKRSGGNWVGICPFHQDTSPSFYVYPNNYHCFACQAHGNVIDYEIHRTSDSFKRTLENLAQAYQFTLEYDESISEKKNQNLGLLQAEQLKILNKILKIFSITENDFEKKELKTYFNTNEMVCFNSLYFSNLIFKKNILSYKNIVVKSLEKENGELYGLLFLVKKPNQDDYETQYISLHKSLIPCFNWNEARPSAIKLKQLIIASNFYDFNSIKNKNCLNVILCIKELSISLLKLFSKRLKNVLLIVPNNLEGKIFLWKTFQNSVFLDFISIDVLLVPDSKINRSEFFNSLNDEKFKNWLNQSQKIGIKVTEIYLNSLSKDKNKLELFKLKILPTISKMKEEFNKNALLLEISNMYFNNTQFQNSLVPKSNFTNQIASKNQNFGGITTQAHVSGSMARNAPQVKLGDDRIKLGDDRIKLGDSIPGVELKKVEYRNELIELTSRSIEYYHKFLVKMNNSQAWTYLKSRKLSLEDIQKWKIGYCSSQHDISKKAQSGLVSKDKLLELGLIKPSKIGNTFFDFFHDRIIIPIMNHKGEYVALSGRVFAQNNELANTKNIPKYINSPESEIFSKSKILFNFYNALESIIEHKFVIIVEGYMDCISLVKAGIDNVVCVMGTALTPYHLQELSHLTKRIIICFDNDKAGQSAAKRTFSASVSFINIELEFMNLPNCKDPDEFIKTHGREEFLNIAKNKNTPLFAQICQWCQFEAKDFQDFITRVQNEFECLIPAQNYNLMNQVQSYFLEKFNMSLKSFFEKDVNIIANSRAGAVQAPVVNKIEWAIKNPVEIKILMALLHLKFSELPVKLQNIFLDSSQLNNEDEILCAQSLKNELSETGLRVFLEISSWMVENHFISVEYVGMDAFELFSPESQILIGFVLSEVKILMRYELQELVKEGLSGGLSMVSYNDVWNLKNAGFLKFHLRNIKLARQNEVLPNLFEEILLNLELDNIDNTLKAYSSLHFDNELDSKIQFLVSERIRCKTKLGNLNLKS